jgi:hypothetical protein
MRLLNRPNRSDETFDIHLTGFLEETASAPCATSLRKYAATDHGSASSTTERDTRRAMSQGDGEAEDGLLLDARAAARFSHVYRAPLGTGAAGSREATPVF